MLSQAIDDLLPYAAGVAISPVPTIAVILMLGTPTASSAAGLASQPELDVAIRASLIERGPAAAGLVVRDGVPAEVDPTIRRRLR